MKKFAEEFKKFIMRGNVMDMAVGVIIGGAFGAITTSLVSNVITPLLAALFKSPNPDALNFTLRATDEAAGTEAIVLGLGTFLGTIINFLVIALALFTVIKAINKAKELAEKAKKKEEEAKAEEPPKPTTEELLAAILEELKKKEEARIEERKSFGPGKGTGAFLDEWRRRDLVIVNRRPRPFSLTGMQTVPCVTRPPIFLFILPKRKIAPRPV